MFPSYPLVNRFAHWYNESDKIVHFMVKPQNHTRVINGKEFTYINCQRNRSGEILFYCYKAEDGTTAYKTNLEEEQSPSVSHQRGFLATIFLQAVFIFQTLFRR